MVETITPVVHGGRGRWAGALALHVAGATLTAALLGAALGGLGSALGAPWGGPGALAVAAVAALFAMAELAGLRVPVPQLRRQVPDWWRTFFGGPTTAFLYGSLLGVGFLTYLAHGTLVAVAVAAASSGRAGLGALLVAPFGLARGLSAIVSVRVDAREQGSRLVERLAHRPALARRVANGAVLGVVAGLALVAAWRAGRGGAEEWGTLGSAALAVVFAWAAASKLASPRRWRRTFDAHRLPSVVTGVVRSAVPIAEALVPVLVVVGERRAAAAWALVLLAVFTAEIVRTRIVIGLDVPCGCFGGRTTAGVPMMLARDAGLAALATVALVAAQDTSVLRLPGMPESRDIVPAALATTGMAVAGLVAWRSAVWLGRSGRA
jgi:methylamine utilization protein MauE